MPEIASRKHIEKINQVITEALNQADKTLDEIDAIGVTYGPGLVGALLVGVAEAKSVKKLRLTILSARFRRLPPLFHHRKFRLPEYA